MYIASGSRSHNSQCYHYDVEEVADEQLLSIPLRYLFKETSCIRQVNIN